MTLARKLRHLTAAQAFQWLPTSLIRANQLRALRRMVRFCERAVPLYRETFRAAGVCAADLRQLEDLQHFPTLTREQVVAAYPEGIRSRPIVPDDVVFRTSGTSGLFMEIAYGAAANDRLDAVYARALFNVGYRPWHRIGYFWEEHRRGLALYERLGLMRKSFLAVSPDPRVNIAELCALDPEVIYVFPSAMMTIARVVEQEGITALRPRLIICHGELLASPIQAEIARIFRCPVYNQYGAQEFNRIGWDCEAHQGMHLDADSVHLEVLDRDQVVEPGAEGELVVTGLHNELMPLIRYRIGDAGRLLPGACSCGRGLPRFEITEGRLDDVLVLADGRKIGPRTLAPRIERLEGFTQYRVVQLSPGELEVLVVCEAEAEPVIEAVRQAVAQSVGPAVTVTVRAVPAIELSRRGKLRKILSQVSADELAAGI